MPAGGAVTAAAVAGPVIGGILGSISASSGRRAAANAAAAALAQLNQLGMPPDLSRQVILQQFQSQGVLTPELEKDINLQASEAGNIKEDASLRNAQMESLATLGQLSRGGLSAGDRAAYNELRNKVQQDTQAKNAQILQRMQAQGMGGSGNELLAQLQSSQAGSDQAAAEADRLAANASQNALSALGQKASLAGNVRGQDFSTNQARAQALDQRNQFLFQNSAAAQARNVAAQNAAQQQNLANKQNIANANTQQGNTESLRQNQAQRDYWNDKLGLATAKANALNNQGSVIQQGANQQASALSGFGNALGSAAGAYGSYAARQPAKTADASSYTPSLDDTKPKYDANGNRIS